MTDLQWFVMRDLKRPNSKQMAYQLLEEQGFQVFTPKVWRLFKEGGKSVRREVPYISNLLFVYDRRENLDPIVDTLPTLQYWWLRHTWREPMTVPYADMERFIHAVESTDAPRFYLPSEITPEMLNRPIRIVGGPLDGYEGTLLTTRGSKTKRLLVELSGLLAVSVEVNPDFIRLIG